MIRRISVLAGLVLALSSQGVAVEQIAVRQSTAAAKTFVQKWFPAWVGGKPAAEKLLEFYSDNVVYVDPNVPRGLKGKDELRPHFEAMLANFPDWAFEIVAIYPTEKGFVLNWKANIPLRNGRTLKDFHGVDILEFDAKGKIQRHEDYYDIAPFL